MVSIVTAFWEAKPDEVDAVQAIVRQFLPQAQREPGVKAFQTHQSTSEPHKFFFYEVFKDEAAFADHQQTDHFKTLIVGQAVPKLAKRERTQHRFAQVRWGPPASGAKKQKPMRLSERGPPGPLMPDDADLRPAPRHEHGRRPAVRSRL